MRSSPLTLATNPEQTFLNAGIQPSETIALPAPRRYGLDTWDIKVAHQALVEINNCIATAATTDPVRDGAANPTAARIMLHAAATRIRMMRDSKATVSGRQAQMPVQQFLLDCLTPFVARWTHVRRLHPRRMNSEN